MKALKVLFLLLAVVLYGCNLEELPEQSADPGDSHVESQATDDHDTECYDEESNCDPGTILVESEEITEGDDETPLDPVEEESETGNDGMAVGQNFTIEVEECTGSCREVSGLYDSKTSFTADLSLEISPLGLTTEELTSIETTALVMPIRHTYFDITIDDSEAPQRLTIKNNTPRKFSSILAITEDSGIHKPVILQLNTTLDSFTEVTYSGLSITNAFYYEPSMAFSPRIRFNNNTTCPERGDKPWTCGRYPSEAGLEGFHTLGSEFKKLFTSKHLLPLLKVYSLGGSYGGVSTSQGRFCNDQTESCATDAANLMSPKAYFYAQAAIGHDLKLGELVTHQRGYTGLGGGRRPDILNGLGHDGENNFAYIVNPDRTDKPGKYRVYLHEMGHGFNYGHSSGFTYGFPPLLSDYIEETIDYGSHPIESAPTTVLTSSFDGKDLLVTIYSNSNQISENVDLKMLALSDFDYKANYSNQNPTIRFEFENPPSARFFIELSSSRHDEAMLLEVFPGRLHSISSNDGMTGLISFEELLNIEEVPIGGYPPSNTFRGARNLCKVLFGRASGLASEVELSSLRENESELFSRFTSDRYFTVLEDNGNGIYHTNSGVSESTGERSTHEGVNLACLATASQRNPAQ